MPKIKSQLKKVADTQIITENQLIFARPCDATSTVLLSFTKNKKNIFYTLSENFLFITLDEIKISFTASWDIEKIPLSRFVTLIAFLDYQQELTGKKTNNVSHIISEEINHILLNDGQKFLITQIKNNFNLINALIDTTSGPQNDGVQHLFRYVRNLESYWVTYFLLSQSMNADQTNNSFKINDAWSKYGVSESHFRKLCHNAFICGPKKQLRLWRAAQSALQLIENDLSISMVATNNGYASASHFTQEMKSIFGFTPKEFRKMVGSFHE